ncbi:GNAT family N-acetyltransferase [Frondihabitans cladoniiphilus]|uniref:GNAT family N-acetyltransferase n=1 Tax=Frondihabitans cladoniiphilus TaxID=715785 RepID=A0ABP8VWQ0_9MICO
MTTTNDRTPTPTSADEFRYVAADGPEVQPLLRDLEREYDSRYGDIFGGAAQELSRYPAERFARPDGAFVLLVRDGVALAGGAFMRYDADTAEIKRVWTNADFRSQGLAKRVLAELEDEARRRGYAHIHLTTGPRQPEAVRLYLGAGYTPQFDTTLPADEVGVHPFRKSLTPWSHR